MVGDVDRILTLEGQVRDLMEEIAEWRAGDRNALEVQHEADEISALVRAYKLTRQQAKVALVLAKAPERYFAKEYIERLTRVGEGSCQTLMSVVVHQIRKRLNIEIETIYGVGWAMGPKAATKVLAAISAH